MTTAPPKTGNEFLVKLFAGGAVVAGLGIGGYFLFVRPWAEAKEKEIILLFEDIEMEVAEMATYAKRMVEEAIPEEVYSAALEAMQQAITKKIERGKDLVGGETLVDWIITILHDFGIDIARVLFLGALVAGSFYGAGWLIKEIIKKRRGPPPSFPCGKCGAAFSTQAALEDHIRTTHPVTTEAATIFQAQLQFQAMPGWVQAGVASEAGIFDRIYQAWTTLEPWEQVLIAIAAAVIVAWLISLTPAGIPLLLLT